MKRILGLLIFVLVFMFTAEVWAAGSCTETVYYRSKYNGMVVKKIACTGDASDGSIPDQTITIDGYIEKVETDPKGTATSSHACDGTCASNEEFALTAHPFTTGSGGDVLQSSITECGMTADTDYYACPATVGATANFFKLDDTDDTCSSILNLTACTLTGVLSNTAPTDNYDMVFNSTAGVDIMGGETDNRDAQTSEVARPKADATYGADYIDTVTMVVTNQSVTNALYDVYLWISTKVPVKYY